MSSNVGHQVGKFIYRGRNTGECPQKLVTKLASLFIGKETGECPQKLVTKLPSSFIGEETLVNVLKSWSPSWQVYL